MYLTGFTVRTLKDRLKPLEDSFDYYRDDEKAILVVADGITRDPKNVPVLPEQNLRNLPQIIKAIRNYPRLSQEFRKVSPARLVADNFCDVTITNARFSSLDGKEIIQEAMQRGNERTAKINALYNPNPDYLENDFWACVASAALIEGNLLSYGFIADCGVKVFDENGKLIMRTANEGPNSKGSIDDDVKKLFGLTWNHPGCRRIIRGQYRNNPHEPLSYGAFTGQRSALHFLRTGEGYIPNNAIVLVHTDGLEKAVASAEFTDAIKRKKYKKLKGICRSQVDNEGSLVICDRYQN